MNSSCNFHFQRVAVKLILPTLLVLNWLSVFSIVLHFSAAADPATVIAIDPATSTANPTPAPGPDQYFTINFTVTDVIDLRGWAIKMRWPTGLLEANTANITEGPFLPLGGSTVFVKKTSSNYIDIAGTGLGLAFTPVNGSGTLATATLKVLKPGNASLGLYDTTLLNSTLGAISHTVVNGTFYTTYPVADFTYTPDPAQYPGRPIVDETVTFNASSSYDPDQAYKAQSGKGIVSYQWGFGDGSNGTGEIVDHIYSAPGSYTVWLTVTDDDGETYSFEDIVLIKLHDIAIADLTVTPAVVAIGSTATINATVMNQGSTIEHFNITAYYIPMEAPEIFPIETKTRVNHPSGENRTITFLWDTTGLPEGTYAIGVNATLVDQFTRTSRSNEEAETADNGMVDGMVTLTSALVHDVAITDITVNPTSVKVNQISSIELTVKNEGNVDEHFNATITVYYGTDVFNTKAWSNETLSAGLTTLLRFDWLTGANATKEGTYNVTARVTLINSTTLGFLAPFNASTPDDDPADNTKSISPVIRMLPVAFFTYSPTLVKMDQFITFNGSGSYAPGDPAGTITKYTWNFGDGTTLTQDSPIAAHAYGANGTFTVSLTVTDEVSQTGNMTKQLNVAPFQNVAITNVTFSPHIATSGESVTLEISVVVRIFKESFNLTAYFNENEIHTQSNVDLQIGTLTTFSFTWDTTDVAEGNYTLKAVAATPTDTTTHIAGIATIEKIQSTITLTASPASFALGSTTSLSGTVTPSLAGINVAIEYRVAGEDVWSALTTVSTESGGTYSYSWTPTTPGTYAIRSRWQGNDTTSSSQSEVAIVEAQDIPPPSPFLYTTIALAVAIAGLAFYFLKLRKPAAT